MKLRVPPTCVKKASKFLHGDFFQYMHKRHPTLLSLYRDELYVLIPEPRTPKEQWRPFMNDAQYEIFMKHGYVLAFARVQPLDEGCAIVHWLETRIPGHGFGTYLRRLLRHTFGDVLPGFIPPESARYWDKELGFKYAREEEISLDEHMNEMCGNLKQYFNWNGLLDVN